ncbi:hypothetical protein [Fimbriiglobus ruber]|uniref:DUF4129 domain-containing protein n=1 Tax=Fimbriiglobus ruber TaxID=1908690 RepID=A0A225EFI8_9BACT|nr:hypothetical protein [Fimbriiglobus ruber]OWK47007.1 hypothetical protein FRUB_00706 [Fimbriiglobus ruber]
MSLADLEKLAEQQRQFQAAAGLWEKHIGPLNDTPEVRNALADMFTGQTTPGEGADASFLTDLLKNADGADASPGNWSGFDLGGFGSGWKWGGGGGDVPSGGDWSAPSTPSGPSFGGFGGGGTGPLSWLPVILFVGIAAGGLILWWLWPRLMSKTSEGPNPLPGLGPWPLDPRTIADRDAVVRAFEYLSLSLCGVGASTWNHVTIATAIRDAVPTSEPIADDLARLYAAARYTPANEPFPPAAVEAARRYLCQLAGVAAT